MRVTPGPLTAAVEGVLGWVVREGVTNVVRHSGARTCEIDVAIEGDAVTAEIRDDGRGPTQNPDATVGGSGLHGLAERMAMAGGWLDSGDRPGGGFTLVASVPLRSGVPDPA
ncbi:MAG: sensor histidine kinase [Acidimicrobiales bacterium]